MESPQVYISGKSPFGDPAKATHWLPLTIPKMDLLRERRRRGLPLFRTDDAKVGDEWELLAVRVNVPIVFGQRQSRGIKRAIVWHPQTRLARCPDLAQPVAVITMELRRILNQFGESDRLELLEEQEAWLAAE